MINEFAKHRWAVVGFDYETAKQIMADIEASSGKEISRRRQGNNTLWTEFTDGTRLDWVKPVEGSKMYRFGKMWCDKNIDENILRCVILPCYRGKREDIIWI